jgi:hypothetical protein
MPAKEWTRGRDARNRVSIGAVRAATILFAIVSVSSSVAPLAILAGCVPDERAPSPPGAKSAGPGPTTLPAGPRIPNAMRDPARATPPPIQTASGSGGDPAAPSADPLLTEKFTDGFDNPALPSWNSTSSMWRVIDGRLCGENTHNHPIWLKRRLPVNARIEFDATSGSTQGDLKAEYWGDGKSAAETISYKSATSYLTIFGGWKNHFHVLARIDEHAANRPEIRLDDSSDDPRARQVAKDQTYHFKVVREDGKTVRWYVDDLEILTYPDPEPLTGSGHDHFGFNDWEVRVCFDNLVVAPLP